MELIEGTTYTTEEMVKFFNISKDTWKKKRDKYLFHLSNFYEYEVQYDKNDYRKLNYHITKQIHEYEPPKRKSAKRDQVYETNIVKVIEKDNVQTAKNVSRIIRNAEEIQKLNHKDGTVYEYTRVRMRNMFGTKAGEHGTSGRIVEKIWCKLDKDNNTYIRLEPEEISAFYELFSSEKEDLNDYRLDLLTDFDNGSISKEELGEYLGDLAISCFINARRVYYDKYGFYPSKVPVYELSAFIAEDDIIVDEENVAWHQKRNQKIKD